VFALGFLDIERSFGNGDDAIVAARRG